MRAAALLALLACAMFAEPVRAGGPNPDETATFAGGDAIFGNVLENDPPPGTSGTVSAVNGSAANVGVQITTALGGRLQIFADGDYMYEPPATVAPPRQDDVNTYAIAGSGTTTLTIHVFSEDVVLRTGFED